MKGRDLPSYITRRARDGVLLFRKRFGQKIVEIRLQTQFTHGEAVPFALHQERERLLNTPTPVPEDRTMANVIARYQVGPKFTGLKRRTQDDYTKRLKFFTGKLGHIEPRSIQRHHVITWLDQWAEDSPHEANYRLRVLRILFERAIDYGLLKPSENPAKGVAEIKYDKKQRSPWPQHLVEAARDTAMGRTLLLFEMLLGTGQRIGDVLEMRWSDFDGEAISVKQNKTKTELWVPATGELLTQLAKAPRNSVFILTAGLNFRQLSYRMAAKDIRDLRAKIGADAYDIHSLRYTATEELARVGLDDDKIMAITGHKTAKMVQLYAGKARQKSRAKAANDAREQNKNRS
jgi:integrase